SSSSTTRDPLPPSHSRVPVHRDRTRPRRTQSGRSRAGSRRARRARHCGETDRTANPRQRRLAIRSALMRIQSTVGLGLAGLVAIPLVASVSASGRSAAATVPTFTKDVAPILYKNCTGCHRPGEIAPMSLLTYEDARPYAKAMRDEISEGHMPPWHADAPVGTF